MSNKSERNQEATVWIGGLDDEVNESLLWELMIQAGPVKSVNIPRDKITGDHSGYAFCEFSSEEDADYAMKIMNMVRLYGKSLKINKASRDRKDTGVGANVFVGNLDPEVDDQLLYNTFSAFGQVLSAKVMYDDDGTSRGFGFVNFADFESSDAAILHMSGQFLCNKSVHVSYAYKKEGTKGEKHGSENERLIAKLQAKTAKRPHMHFSAAPNLLNGSNNDRNNNNSTSSNNDRNNNNNSNNISSNKSNIQKQKPILPVNIQSRTNLPPPPPIPNQSLKLNSNSMQLQQLVMAAAMSQQLHLQSHSMNQIPKPKPPPPPMPSQQSTTIINNQPQTNNNSQLNPNNNPSSNQSKIPEPISKKPPITSSNNPLIKRLPPPPPHQSLLPQQTWMNQMNPQLLQQQQRMLMNQRLIQQQQWNQVNQQQSNHLKIPSKQPPPPPTK